MYFNAVILLTLGAASAAISLRRRSWKPVLIVAGIGIAVAVSLLPYAETMSRQNQWSAISKCPLTLPWIAGKFAESVNTAGGFMVWIWLAVFIMAAVACGYTLVRRAQLPSPAGRTRPNGRGAGGEGGARLDAGIYAGTSLAVGAIAYTAFIYSVGVPTNIWYYMPLMGLLALSFDVAFEASAAAHGVGRVVRLLAVLGLALLTVPAAWQAAHERITNINLIAAILNDKAGKEDLIVVSPWWPGVSFHRYYHGAAPWTTLPDLGPVHRQPL